MNKALTQEEVDALPDGTKVLITWSGGNGPHEYEVVQKNGLAYAKWVSSFMSPILDIRVLDIRVSRIRFVGPKQPFTEVRLVDSS